MSSKLRDAEPSTPTPLPAYTPKNIVLFSDGTGNSSSKLQKTNVWRLYEALDLGDPAKDDRDQQIAYYDDGVGNSTFRLLAILGGIFGFGLSRNVRELYMFLCRNYRNGDRIYAFGFSRGSYTIRLLVAMIAQFGIVPYRRDHPVRLADGSYRTVSEDLSERDLALHAADMWREFRRGFRPNNPISDYLCLLWRSVRTGLTTAKRKALGQPRYATFVDRSDANRWFFSSWTARWFQRKDQRLLRQRYSAEDWEEAAAGGLQEIEFVGVFDTVAAYGGPVVELTRAIDEWFWPLSMPDYRLSPMVKKARHALAIDDKRGSFEPLLWDEVFERCNPAFRPDRPRMQQVWFAGMHADVGGGYSDESLSYVPLLWMLEHGETSGLHFIDHMRDRIEQYANPHGFMHDSRRGMGAFYRYQPRYINAWLDKRSESDLDILMLPRREQDKHLAARGESTDPRKIRNVSPLTGLFRDQAIDRGRYQRQGFLVRPLRVHIDAVRRIEQASDGYAPVNMVDDFDFDDGPRGVTRPENPISADPRHFSALGTRIRIRRMWYFMSMLLMAVLASLPFWNGRFVAGRPDPAAPCGRTGTSELAAAICEYSSYVLPDFVATHLGLIFAVPVLALLFLGLAIFTAMKGSSQEVAMGDIARRNWAYAFNPGTTPIELPRLGWLKRRLYRWSQRARLNVTVQRTMASLKWQIIPNLLGPAMWALLILFVLPAIIGDALPWLWAEATFGLDRLIDAAGLAAR